jgi:hypothetical protein
MRGARAALIALAATAAALAAAPVASAATQTAHAGTVTATFTYQGHLPTFTGMRLQIARGGTVVYDQPVNTSKCGGKYCGPASTSAKYPSVQVVALDGGAEPNVILSLWTGGANCCVVDQVFFYAPAAATYAVATHNFAYGGATIKDLDHNGRHEFVTDDGRFKYEFTDGAASGLPIRILTFSAGRFLDVTRHYPALIAKDAALWLRTFRQTLKYHDTVGLIAAWAADEELLGHRTLVTSYLHTQLLLGHLRTPTPDVQPGGQRFINHLMRFLRRLGYLR